MGVQKTLKKNRTPSAASSAVVALFAFKGKSDKHDQKNIEILDQNDKTMDERLFAMMNDILTQLHSQRMSSENGTFACRSRF